MTESVEALRIRNLTLSTANGLTDVVLTPYSLEIGQGSESVPLTQSESSLLSVLSAPLGAPRLAVQIAVLDVSLSAPVEIGKVYESVKDKLRPTELTDLLIKVGRGKATWYGLLDELSDESLRSFAETGISTVDDSRGPKYLLSRRRQPFIHLLDVVENGDDNSRFTTDRKHMAVAGAAAIAITIGSAATIYVKHRKDK